MIKVKLYMANIHDLPSNILDIPYLTNEDIEGCLRYKQESDQKLHLLSCYLKRKYIKDFKLNAESKPISDNLYFNISHSNEMVIMGVNDTTDIGVDIEYITPVKDNLRRYISSDTEYDYIKSDLDFYQIWTSKEALVKCLGIGLNTKIKEITSLPINGLRRYQNELFYSKNIKINDYVVTVVLKSDSDFDLEIIEEKISQK